MKKMNVRRVRVTMRNGSVFYGFINIGSCRRLSDFLRKSDDMFVVIFDAMIGEGKERGVYFLNWNHILWVEPGDAEGREGLGNGAA